MAKLSLEQLLTRETKDVDLPAGAVTIRKLNAREYAASCEVGEADGLSSQQRFVRQAAHSCGCALVEPAVDDWESLLDLPLTVLGDLYQAVIEFAGLGADGESKEVDRRVEEFPSPLDAESGPTVDAPADGEALAGAAEPAG